MARRAARSFSAAPGAGHIYIEETLCSLIFGARASALNSLTVLINLTSPAFLWHVSFRGAARKHLALARLLCFKGNQESKPNLKKEYHVAEELQTHALTIC